MGCCNSKESVPIGSTATNPNQQTSDDLKTDVVLPTSAENNPVPSDAKPAVPINVNNPSITDADETNANPRLESNENKEKKNLNSNPILSKFIENQLNQEFDKDREEQKINNDDILENPEVLNNNFFQDTIQNICEGNHSFAWKPDLVYSEMVKKDLQTSPIHLTCCDCLQIFSRASWQCTVCASIICNSCGEAKSLERPIIKCTRGHEVTWSIDTWAYSIEKKRSNRANFICSTCRKTLQEPAYICRACIYYSCISCSKKKGICPPIDEFKCRDGDPLELTRVSEPFNCRQCEQPAKDTSYSCKNCNETLCKLCTLKTSLKMVRHPGLRCRENHPTMGLCDLKTLKTKEKQLCISCCGSMSSFTMICVYCLDRCCLDCSESIQSNIEKNIGKNLDNFGIVEWYKYVDVENSENVSCSKCEFSINSGIYFLTSESKNCCIGCVNDAN